jgi:hypothetical protein
MVLLDTAREEQRRVKEKIRPHLERYRKNRWQQALDEEDW